MSGEHRRRNCLIPAVIPVDDHRIRVDIVQSLEETSPPGVVIGFSDTGNVSVPQHSDEAEAHDRAEVADEYARQTRFSNQ